jgi:Zn-dependent protease
MFWVPVKVRPDFFLLAGMLTYGFWRTGTREGLISAVALGAILLFSIWLHEMAHAEVARRCGIGRKFIEIGFFGGLVHLRRMPYTRGGIYALLLAGPASNLALGLLLAIVTAGLEHFGLRSAASVAEVATIVNLALFAINMLPAFPLDGGRALHRFLAETIGEQRSLLIIGGCGSVLAILSIVFAVATGLSGFPIYVPIDFRRNWSAFRRGRSEMLKKMTA